MKIEENVLLGSLLDIYGELLSEKQKNMLDAYVNQDMSLAEIAEDEGISRTAVLDSINLAKNKLFKFEEKLKFNKFKTSVNQILNSGKDIKSEIAKLMEEF